MPIIGKVAKILDEVKVVINRGSKDGVKPGMRFVAYAEADEVTDPDTGESLGKWELVSPLSRVAVACEAGGLLIDVHNSPEEALCDGSQSLKPEKFKHLMADLKTEVSAVGRKM